MIGGESWGSAVTPESDDDGDSAAVANRPYHTTHQTFNVDSAELNEAKYNQGSGTYLCK